MRSEEQTSYALPEVRHSVFCEQVILWYAIWTLSCHLTVFTGGDLLDLFFSFTLISLLILFLRWRLSRYKKDRRDLPTIRDKTEQRKWDRQTVLLSLLIVIAVGLTLIAHRPDEDDSMYVNRAVAAVDSPKEPLLQYINLHSPQGVLTNRRSKVVSLEMLAATLSLLTHLPALSVFHLLFAPFAALLAVLAYGELFKILAPKHWSYGVLAVMVFLWADGAVHRTYGNFSFVRLHQGKGILLSVIVPLLLTYGLRFASNPTPRNWLLLSSIQIAAVGVSKAGILIAPPMAALAVFTGVMGNNSTTQFNRVVAGLTTSVYVIGIGLYVRLFRTLSYLYYHGPLRSYTPSSSSQFFKDQTKLVFGNGRFAVVCLLIILTAWFWCKNRIARRFCLIFPVGIGVFFANPFVADLVATHLTGKLYWRIFWMLPLPTMAGLTLIAPLSSGKLQQRYPKLQYILYVSLLVLLVSGLSEQHIFSKTNRASLRFPGLKVHLNDYRIAGTISNNLKDRLNVLAPESISLWLPTMHHHPYPLVSRFLYAHTLGEQKDERTALTLYIMGQKKPENISEFFPNGIQKYRIAAVCIPQSNPWAEDIYAMLETLNFTIHQRFLSHEIWMRKITR